MAAASGAAHDNCDTRFARPNCVSVCVISGRRLVLKGARRSAPLFAAVRCGAAGGGGPASRCTSLRPPNEETAKANGTAVYWNEVFSFPIGDLSQEVLECSVHQQNLFGLSETLVGQLRLPLEQLYIFDFSPHQTHEDGAGPGVALETDLTAISLRQRWYPLKGKKMSAKFRGDLALYVQFSNGEEQIANGNAALPLHGVGQTASESAISRNDRRRLTLPSGFVASLTQRASTMKRSRKPIKESNGGNQDANGAGTPDTNPLPSLAETIAVDEDECERQRERDEAAALADNVPCYAEHCINASAPDLYRLCWANSCEPSPAKAAASGNMDDSTNSMAVQIGRDKRTASPASKVQSQHGGANATQGSGCDAALTPSPVGQTRQEAQIAEKLRTLARTAGGLSPPVTGTDGKPLFTLDTTTISANQTAARRNRSPHNRNSEVVLETLSKAELISLVKEQRLKLSKQQRKLREYEEYIDDLLTKVIDKQPDLLQQSKS